MAITAAFEDSASIGTGEYSLPADTTSGVPTAQTDDGIYQLFLDLHLLAAGDLFELKIYEKVQSGGTQYLADQRSFGGVQATPVVVLPGLILMHGWDITLKKIAGTDRTIGWSIRKVA